MARFDRLGLGVELLHPNSGVSESRLGKMGSKEGQSSGDAPCLCVWG